MVAQTTTVRVVVAFAATLVALALLAASAAAQAGTRLDVVAAIEADGSAPFDGDDAAGHDSAPDNGIARTNDSLLVRLDWSVNRGDGPATVLRSTLPVGLVWSGVPAGCAPASSALGDGDRTLRCELGDQPEGSAGVIHASAQLTQAQQGDTFAIGATLDATGAGQATSNTVTVTASAAPVANLRANVFPGFYQPDIVRFVPHPDSGAVGVLIRWYFTLELPGGGRGAEGFSGDLTFNQSVSGMSANTQLVNWQDDRWGPSCSPTVRLSAFVPFGKDIGSLLDNPQNTTRDSGAWSCSQTAPGQPISVTVTGADWASSHFPTNAGYLLPLTGRKVVVSGYVTTWSPNTDLPGGTKIMSTSATGLDLHGVSGAAVSDSVPSDNSVSALVTTTAGGTWETWMEAPYKELAYDDPFSGPGPHRDTRLRIVGAGAGNRFIATGSEVNYAGDSVTLPGDVVTVRMNSYTRTFPTPQPGRVMCAKVDPNTLEVIQTPPIRRDVPDLDPLSPTYFQTLSSTTVPAPDGAVILRAFENVTDYSAQSTVEGPLADPAWVEGVDYDVQYGFKAFTGTADLGQTTCDDGATANGQWYDTLAAANSAAAGAGARVDIVRIILRRTVDERMNVAAWLSLRVRDAAPGTFAGVYTGYGFFNQPWPGTLPAANWVLCKASGATCTYYNAATHPSGAQDWGDRTRIGDVTYAVTHERVPDSGNPNIGEVGSPLAPGEDAVYRVTGGVLGPPGSSASASNVRITLTVPAGQRYLPGSSEGAAEPTVTDNGDGTQTLVYDLGSVPVGTSVPIDYRTEVRSTATPFATETAVAVISGDQAVVQPAVSRTANAYAAYSGSYARLRIDEQADAPTIVRGGELRYSIPLSNPGPLDLADPTVVNVLPFNGDDAIAGRRSGSRFHGTVRLGEVLAPSGATVTFTSAPGAQVGRDRDGTLPAGFLWCTEPELGQAGCPASLADVTAFRVVGPPLPAGAAARVINVRLTTAGNECGDTYVNDSSGGDGGIELPVESRDVDVAVVGCEPPPEPEPPTPPTPPTPPISTPAPPPPGEEAGAPRLTIRKSAARRVVTPGQSVRYRITVRNRGTATAERVRVCDRPSAGLAVARLPATARLRGGDVCWRPFTLRAGERRTLTITMSVFRSSAGKRVRNSATVTANGVRARTAQAAVRTRQLPAPGPTPVTG